MQSNNASNATVGSKKTQQLLRLIFTALMLLEILKLVELSVVYIIKQNIALLLCIFAILVAIRNLKQRSIFNLSLITIVNFIMIFKYDIVNQHFAFLTSLLIIFLLEAVLSKTPIEKEILFRITAILLVSQVSILYLFAAIWKMNLDYLTGMQMLEHIRPFLILPNFQNPEPVVYIGLSAIGLAIELILSLQFLFRRLAFELVQSMGFFFHIMMVILIGESLRISFQLIIFAAAALVIYPLCVSNNWGDYKFTVFWDSHCDFCAKSIKVFKHIDQDLNFSFVSNLKLEKYNDLPFDKNLVNDTIIVFDQQSGQYWIKSQAILYIISHSFFFWFAKPLIRLPYVFRLTDKLYDRVASRRTCHI